MTNPTRTFPAYDLKGGDIVNGHEVLDVIDVFRRKVAILFTDGSPRLEIASWDTMVEVDN